MCQGRSRGFGRKILIETVGCQMNVLDARSLRGMLKARGFASASTEEEADAVVIFTCSVRRKPEEKVFSRIGRLADLKRRKPGLLICVAGCMAERLGAGVIARAPAIDAVAGPGSLGRLVLYLESPSPRRGEVLTGFDGAEGSSGSGFGAEGASAFVSVMTGCRKYCAYCIVPFVRGPETSRRPEDVVAEVEALALAGVAEVTLLGQNISAYAGDPAGLPGLLRRVCAVPGPKRIRFLTSHPSDFNPALLDLFREYPALCPHLQMPAQSGSDAVLSRMNRGYTGSDYLDLVGRIREAVPAMEITSDFIVGFPGETDRDFEATLRLAEEAGFRNAFAFKYVPRPGTAAWDIPDDVPPETKQSRLLRLLNLQKKVSLERNRAMIGRTVEVMVEGPDGRNPARSIGRTSWNHIVSFAGVRAAGDFVDVSVTGAEALTLFGEQA